MLSVMVDSLSFLFPSEALSFEHLVYCFSTFQNAVPQKGGEVNLTLGGIDLNNSGRLACFLNLDVLELFLQGN